MGLHTLDILVLLGVGATAVFGWMRGFVCEVLSLFAWVLVVFALKLVHAPVTQALGRHHRDARPARRCWRSR